jgi:hypothetical protein
VLNDVCWMLNEDRVVSGSEFLKLEDCTIGPFIPQTRWLHNVIGLSCSLFDNGDDT